MAIITRKLSNFLEYFGVRSDSYYHSEARANYDPEDPLAYYLDHTARANYPGPRDDAGVPLYVRGGKTAHLPVLNALIALGRCDLYRRNQEKEHLAELLKIADWFERSRDERGVWRHPFPFKAFGLPVGFPSAMTQGMGISVLVRAFRLTEKAKYHQAALDALRLFHVYVADGGVRTGDEGQIFYEEYPSPVAHHVLNGFIYAMWGLHDLVRLDDNGEAADLWADGLATLVDWLPRYDMGQWSLYHIGDGMTNPATIPYHKLHIEQLKAMHAITSLAIFDDYATRWQEYLDGRWSALRTLPLKIAWNVFKGV